MRYSSQATALLTEMLNQPAGQHYGLTLARTTRLASGTLYPILFRLEREGWLSSEWENIDRKVEGSSPRKFYQFTPAGLEGARSYVLEAHARG